MDKKELAQLIDHTLLVATATRDDVQKLCQEAIEYGFKSVCVNSFWVKKASKFLAGSNVKVCTVVGFPLGAMSTEGKAYEAVQAVNDGATEIDMVLNIGAVKSGDWKKASRDMHRVIKVVKDLNRDVIVKVIIETCLLTDEEKIEAVQFARLAGADFTKTSTGFSTGGATVKDVKLMLEHGGIPVKASGGVRTLESVLAMVDAGATRIGTSNGVAIVKELEGEPNASGEGY